jgi:uncharacterized protein GlcG (DUF336 family)
MDLIGSTRFITLEGAKKMMTAAEAEARKNSWNVAIAIVDAGGNLILFQKIDGAQTASCNIAVAKARTAVNFKRPSKAMEELITGGRLGFLAVDGLLPLQGGLPVVWEGKVIGAVGVSGVKSSEDEQIAEEAIAALGLQARTTAQSI